MVAWGHRFEDSSGIQCEVKNGVLAYGQCNAGSDLSLKTSRPDPYLIAADTQIRGNVAPLGIRLQRAGYSSSRVANRDFRSGNHPAARITYRSGNLSGCRLAVENGRNDSNRNKQNNPTKTCA
jgi:hypothetical protein